MFTFCSQLKPSSDLSPDAVVALVVWGKPIENCNAASFAAFSPPLTIASSSLLQDAIAITANPAKNKLLSFIIYKIKY